MEENVFTNVEELYNLLLPALTNKKEDLKKRYLLDIEEIEIWNYLKDKKWQHAYNLFLYQMVNDIMNVDSILIIDYYKKDSDIYGNI